MVNPGHPRPLAPVNSQVAALPDATHMGGWGFWPGLGITGDANWMNELGPQRHHAVANPDIARSLRYRRQDDLGRGRMVELLQKMMLDSRTVWKPHRSAASICSTASRQVLISALGPHGLSISIS